MPAKLLCVHQGPHTLHLWTGVCPLLSDQGSAGLSVITLFEKHKGKGEVHLLDIPPTVGMRMVFDQNLATKRNVHVMLNGWLLLCFFFLVLTGARHIFFYSNLTGEKQVLRQCRLSALQCQDPSSAHAHPC